MTTKKRKKLTTDFNPVVILDIDSTFEGRLLSKRDVIVEGENRKIYTFRGKNGIEVDIWGSGQLNQYMAKIEVGTYCFIKRTADVPSPSYPKMIMKTYDVEIEE